jgi:purine nucleosidase
MRLRAVFTILFASLASAAFAGEPRGVPVIFDTDIGTDIDDAYALVALMHRPELRLLGVTTVSGDAVARARLAAKLMHVAGGEWRRVPVYAGLSGSPQYMKQVDWADGFAAPNLHDRGGVEFMRRQINARPGEITLIAVGELTNIAALLGSEKGIGKKIRSICLMGGAIYRGHAPESKPEPEWNIRSNTTAARTVLTSGVPLRIAPLDSTADLKLTPEMRVEIFARGVPLNDALAALDAVWRHTNHWKGDLPTLFDVLAVDLARPGHSFKLTPLAIEVTANGLTRPVEGAKPNADVALAVDVPTYMGEFVQLLR